MSRHSLLPSSNTNLPSVSGLTPAASHTNGVSQNIRVVGLGSDPSEPCESSSSIMAVVRGQLFPDSPTYTPPACHDSASSGRGPPCAPGGPPVQAFSFPKAAQWVNQNME